MMHHAGTSSSLLCALLMLSACDAQHAGPEPTTGQHVVASWHAIRYHDGPGGLDPPTLAPEAEPPIVYRLSRLPHPTTPTFDQLLYAASELHRAVLVRIDRDAIPDADAPMTIAADISSLDADSREIDRIDALPLFKLPETTDTGALLYASDLTQPIIVVDVTLAKYRYPRFVLLRADPDSSLRITPRLDLQPHPPAMPAQTRPPGPTLDPTTDPITHLEQGPRTTPDLIATLDAIRAQFDPEDDRAIARLIGVVNDTSLHRRIRNDTLVLLLDQPDPNVLLHVLHAASSWDYQPSPAIAILRRLPNHPALPAAAPTPAFEKLLVNALASSPWLDQPGPPLLTLLACAPMREEAREQLATETILRARAADFLNKEFVFAVRKPEDIAAIRNALAECPNDAQQFHYGAASALAMLGDPVAAANLHKRAKELASRRDEPGFGNFVRRIEYFAAFADAAAAPDSIVHYIAEDANPPDWIGICAALRIAARMNLKRGDVRPAILALSERARAAAAKLANKRRTRHALAMIALVPVRTTAIELGFLDTADLPDVEAFAREQAKHAPTP